MNKSREWKNVESAKLSTSIKNLMFRKVKIDLEK